MPRPSTSAAPTCRRSRPKASSAPVPRQQCSPICFIGSRGVSTAGQPFSSWMRAGSRSMIQPSARDCAIAPAIIESCPTRLFLPNERAVEPQILSIYRRFGLNDRQIEIIARATPKCDYYCQSRRGNRLFELGLGEVALAFTAASSKADQAAITDVLATHGRAGFASAWLRHKGLDWAVELLAPAAAPDPEGASKENGS